MKIAHTPEEDARIQFLSNRAHRPVMQGYITITADLEEFNWKIKNELIDVGWFNLARYCKRNFEDTLLDLEWAILGAKFLVDYCLGHGTSK